MYLTKVLLAVTCLIIEAGSSSWYQGCYVDRSEQIGQDGVNIQSVDSTLVGCAKKCLELRYLYFGIQKGDNCVCLNSSRSLSAVEDSQCTRRCQHVTTSISLYCGGAGTQWSLYLSAGPYLVAMTAEVQTRWITINTDTPLDTEIQLARFINFTQDSSEEWLGRCNIIWRVEGQQFSANVTGYGNKLASRNLFAISKPGTFLLEVTASNVISSLTRQYNVTVILPAPRDLQIVPLNESDNLPSCISETFDNLLSEVPVIAAFVNVSLALEVSVSVGTKLTFNLQHGESGSEDLEEYLVTPDCKDLHCHAIVKDFKFSESGVYTVAATVSNKYGALHKNITVVVMEKKLCNVTFDLQEDTNIYRTNVPVKFLVTVETTARQHTFLRVNFGLGEEKEMMLREQKNRSVENRTLNLFDEQSLDGFALTASYGEGCNLSIMFQYIYRLEGTFKPRIQISSKNSYLTMNLREDLVIQQELSSPKLTFERTTVVNQSTEVYLALHKFSVNLSVVWTILDKDQNILENISGSFLLNYTFHEPGQYLLIANASNLINSVSTSAPILVQTAIYGLSVNCFPEYHAVVSEEVVCSAQIEEGSDVTFSWNFHDQTRIQMTQGNLTSTVGHRFRREGEFPISLRVFNEISNQIVTLKTPMRVEREIKSIQFIFHSRGEIVNELSSFSFHPECDCMVDLEFDFGQGRRKYEYAFSRSRKYKINSRRNPYIYVVTHNFTKPGVFPVTVYAFNNVSNASNSIEVTVQRPIGKFEIKVQGHAMPGKKTVVVAKAEGDIMRREDCIYRWTFPGGREKETLVPLAEFTFDEEGIYSVNLTIRNLVDSVSKQREVIVQKRAPAEIGIEHNVAVKTYEEVDFTLLGKLSGIVVTVNYSDGEVEQYFNQTSWKHAFSYPGVYGVSTTIKGNGSPIILQSYIAVEEPIKSLRLDGLTAIKIEKNVHFYSWTARTESGSHVLYIWSLNNATSNRTTNNQFRPDVFRKAGVETLSVKAENDVSSAETSLNILVQYPILYTELNSKPVPLGVTANITVDVRGGQNFTLFCNFGDGTTFNTTSHSHSGVIEIVEQANSNMRTPPIYRLMISHVYDRVGDYEVNVTAANMFSSVSDSTFVSVGQPISGIKITSNAKPIIAFNSKVSVNVTVETGADLVFKWELEVVENENWYKSLAPTEINSEPQSSSVSFSFTVADKIQIMVKISNKFYPKPIVKKLPFIIHVIEPIDSTTVFYVKVKDSVAVNTELTFRAYAEVSDVMFHFDYGDGSTQISNGTENLMSGIMEGVGVHKYTEVGVYSVRVTASNPLGSVTTLLKNPIQVQVPPAIKPFENSEFCSVFGTNITFEVTLLRGTNVTFDWHLGDETELINAGARISHQYRSVGKKVLVVSAHNMVGEMSKYTDVNVVIEIQGVNLTTNTSVIGNFEKLEYRAMVEPKLPSSVEYYNWTFDHVTVITNEPNHIFDFQRSGLKIVTVAAINCASRAVSAPLKMNVMARVQSLSLNMQGDSLVNQPITFIALLWGGDDHRFTWDFGDGSRPMTGTNTSVTHTYKKLGEYVVNLTAENLLSSETTTTRLFILNKVCKPPVVTIIGSKTKWFTFFKSEQVHIETRVKVNCTFPAYSVNYSWTFINSTSVEVQVPVERKILQKQTLILPPLSLPVGEYTVLLHVNISGQIVYTDAKLNLNIVPSPLRSEIEGGMRRSVSYREETITLDGSRSRDPDHRNQSHISFRWLCQTISNQTCYNITELRQSGSEFDSYGTGHWHQLVLTKPIVTIPVRLLLTDERRFLFVLTISTPDGRNKTSDQVIDIDKENEVMRLKISCHQCQNNLVNPNEKISLRTACINCPRDVQFRWSVFVIYNSYQQDVYPDKCGAPDGRKSLQYVGNQSETIETTSTSTAETLLTSTFPTTEKTTSASEQDIKVTSEEKIGFYFPHEPFLPIPDEHIPNSKRTLGQQNNKGKPDPSEDKKDEDQVTGIDKKRGSSLPIHISQEITHSFNLPADQTLTGLDKPSLVIRPRYLHQNKTFIVQVEASSPGMTHKYIAQTYFRVNRSPSKGRCTVKPERGVEMQTEFTVFCNEWIDEDSQFSSVDQSLTYEVAYRLNQKNDILVYRGASHDIVFTLPAGSKHENYTVLLEVSILDNFGARTAYCTTPVVVLPRDPRNSLRNANNSVLYLSEMEAVEKASRHGDDRSLCILVGNIARRLNGLPKVPRSSADMKNRRDARDLFLKILKSQVPMRDKGEVIQAAQSLVAATAVPDELNSASLHKALDLLDKIQIQTEALDTDSANHNQDMLSLAIQVVSSIVGAAAEKSSGMSGYLTAEAITVLDKLLKVELHHHSIGEVPIQRSAEFVSVLGSHFTPGRPTEIRINQAQFKLPSNMAALDQTPSPRRRNQTSRSINDDCFQAHLTTFKRNPFAHLDDGIWKVETEVLALNLYTCNGRMIEVANLTSDNLVEIQIPHNEEQKATYSEHVLEKKNMNIHEFNLTDHVDQPLHISIQLEPVTGRTFPLSILISYAALPSPKSFDLRRDFPVGVDDIKIFLPSGTFNRSGNYYLGIVDSHYNAGRHREGQVLTRNYTFSLWLGNCLFWDEDKSSWSTQGCRLTEESTAETLHCRCNHLTAFGGHFQLVPNDLTFVNIENFFNLKQNPVTIILVSLVFCVYFVLLALCRQADLHDEKKGGIVYLKDNGGADKQQYEITVETGFRMGAGSTAKISIIIHGEEGMSETRELFSDDSRPLFERNSRDKFVMTHPDSLGKLKKVQLWHNNSGPSPSWYLSRVLVKDLVTGHVYYFLCEKWFAVEEEDGKVEREILALDGNLGFTKVFWAKGTQYMADFHLWASLVTRPSYSRFTRTQRLTCCLTLLMSYMCLNAMWYRETKPEVRGEFGLLDVSWQNLTVGAIICGVLLPLNLLLSFLFRRSRVHFPGMETEPGKTCEEHTVDPPEESGQPTMMYSLLDQSILNWQSIQEWAQKQWLKREQSVRSGANSVKTNNQSQSPQSQTASTLPVLQTLRKEEETDVASSGFEDSASQAYSQGAGERNRVQATPTGATPTHTTPTRVTPTHTTPTRVTPTHTTPTRVTPTPTGMTHTHTSQTQSPRCHVTYHREPCNLHASRRIFLPFWCRYVAWVLCAAITVLCAGVTILYGFRFGRTKSVMWIQSLYFSFMICVFIAQPFLILLTVIYTALRHRDDLCILDHYDDGFYGNNNEATRRRKQREIDCCEECEELERGVAARQRSRYLRFARPPQEKTLIEARKRIIKEKKTLALFRDSVAYCCMFLLLTIMAYGKDTASPFYCNQALRQHFLQNSGFSFYNIKTRGDWFRWSQSSLLDSLYKDAVVTDSRKSQVLLSPVNSYLIGPVHVRQLRVQEEECVLYNQVPVNHTCRYGYSSWRRDDSVVGGANTSWTRPSPYSFVLWGQHASYDERGSTIQLLTNRSEAYLQLQDLETSNWLDLQTRVVIVEMTLINIPTNQFSSVSLVLELPPTGGAVSLPIIMSTEIFRYVSYWDNCVLACELLFVVLTMITIRSELCAIVRQHKKYFSNLWNYVEMGFGLLSLVFIGCFMFRFVLVADIVEDLRNSFYEEFVNISFLATWDELLRSLVGMLYFCVMVKMLTPLSYVRVCAKYSSIYKRARKEIIIFMALFIFTLCAFTGMGVALFGSVSLGLRNAWFGLFSMTALMTRIASHQSLEHEDSSWWPVFVLFYLVFGVGLLTSYMVAVLTRRLKVYKQGSDTLTMGVGEGARFLAEKFLFWSGIRRIQPMEEPENVLPPEFTMAEIEYQVDELLFRMNNLTGSSGLPEKPPGYLTDSTDASNGAGDDGISSGGSEDQAGMDVDRLGHRVQKIEDKLYANEPYLAQLIKLDSIGADVLSQEKEKQLRSHLELEVFRHLQMQRSESSATTEFPSNQMPVVMATLCGSSLEGSPSSESTGSHKLPILELPKAVQSGGDKQTCIIPMPPQDHHPFHNSTRNPLSPEAGSSSPESPHDKRSDVKPKVKVGPPIPPKPTGKQLLVKTGQEKNKPSSSSENASPQSSESEKRHRRTDSSSGHSGSVERGGSLKRPTVKPELPPKPTFIQTTLREQSHLDSSKSLSGSQKLRQFKLPPDRVLQRGDFCSNIAAESSSGSEQDAAHVGRRPSGKRNLRKTKSRGKGKGSGSLSPALMLEDLALENPDSIDVDQVDMIEEVLVHEQQL